MLLSGRTSCQFCVSSRSCASQAPALMLVFDMLKQFKVCGRRSAYSHSPCLVSRRCLKIIRTRALASKCSINPVSYLLQGVQTAAARPPFPSLTPSIFTRHWQLDGAADLGGGSTWCPSWHFETDWMPDAHPLWSHRCRLNDSQILIQSRFYASCKADTGGPPQQHPHQCEFHLWGCRDSFLSGYSKNKVKHKTQHWPSLFITRASILFPK